MTKKSRIRKDATSFLSYDGPCRTWPTGLTGLPRFDRISHRTSLPRIGGFLGVRRLIRRTAAAGASNCGYD
jgi:hypothetical protein